MQDDTAPVRAGEEIDEAALAAWLGVPVEVEQFPNGHSNLVYLVRAGGIEYVLRRPPLGPVAPKAHDMGREYRVLEAVHPQFPEAPRVHRLCEDPTVIGAPFFMMERRHGIVLRDDAPSAWSAIPDYPQRVSQAFVDCLVRLHAVDIADPRVASLGKPEGFLERQVRGWAERWRRAETEEIDAMSRVIEWLAGRIPRSPAPALVHNDFKLDNAMFRDSADALEAVLDWEMATLGDPLADLGLTLCYWVWAGVAEADHPHPATPVITTRPGWFTRDEFVERYARATGREVTNLGWYEVLGIFKLAVILQQIYFRYRCGQTSDIRFHDFDVRVRGLVSLAGRLVEQSA